MFIFTERTPNPEALKFIPQVRLTEGASRSFQRAGFDAAASPLAARLFALEGVRQVFVAPDFVTVSRERRGPGWDQLRYQVIAAIADHMESGAEAVAATASDSGSGSSYDELEAEIREVLGRHVRPGVARDGGDVLFDRFEPQSGVLWIRMQGACGGCPSAQLTLKSGVERIVRHYVPEVLRVEETPTDQAAEPSRFRRWISGSPTAAGAKARTVFTHSGYEIRRGNRR